MVSDASFLLSFLEHITLTKTFKKIHVHKTDPVFCLHASISSIVKILPYKYSTITIGMLLYGMITRLKQNTHLL